MNWDILLHWMTHLGEGSWEGFKDAVERLASEDEKLDDRVISLRLHLSDMGHADFFVGGSRRWCVLPPVLAGLAAEPGAAVLCGGRTPTSGGALVAAGERAGCVLLSDGATDGPTTLRIQGEAAALAGVASEVGIRFVSEYAVTLCSQLTPVFEMLERAPVDSPPTNWALRSFDFETMSLVDGLRKDSACECSPRRGLPRWFVHQRHGKLRPMPKREAIYAAAMLQRVTLLRYDIEKRRLSAPVKTPPPESYSRVACLCAGRRARVEGRLMVFDEVPGAIAAVLCVGVGQPHPGVEHRVLDASMKDEHDG